MVTTLERKAKYVNLSKFIIIPFMVACLVEYLHLQRL